MVNLRKRLKDYPSIISWEEEIICTFSYFHLLQGINFNSPMRKCCIFLGKRKILPFKLWVQSDGNAECMHR